MNFHTLGSQVSWIELVVATFFKQPTKQISESFHLVCKALGSQQDVHDQVTIEAIWSNVIGPSQDVFTHDESCILLKARIPCRAYGLQNCR